MKKTIIDITCIHSIDRKTALQLVKKANQYCIDPDSIEIMGDFQFVSRFQYEQINRMPTMYQRLKFYILERLASSINDRIIIENKFII